MRLFDTRRNEVVEFDPPDIVTMYTCGITPYDAAHLGHAATYIAYDVLQRRLRDIGHVTRCVRNVTDIDDDMVRKSRETGENWKSIGDRETQHFDQAMHALGLLEKFSAPRASDAIDEIVDLVSVLCEKGHAYESNGSVYFDSSSWSRFGELSKLDRSEMLTIAGERGGHIDDANKHDPLDFVLWQACAQGEPYWDSPWGHGRPGWHIECSALAKRELGATIDLHGGGSDLIFPHHECEIAQSEGANGQTFVKHWMHVAMVRMNGEKMSKSLGNLVFVRDLLETWDAATIRVATSSHHYRDPWEWNDTTIPDAHIRLTNWRKAGVGNAGLEEVRAALDDDLNTPRAMAAIDRHASEGSGVSEAAALLGIVL